MEDFYYGDPDYWEQLSIGNVKDKIFVTPFARGEVDTTIQMVWDGGNGYVYLPYGTDEFINGYNPFTIFCN